MIPRTIPTWQSQTWQEELSELITRPEELFNLLELDPALLPAANQAADLFPFRTTRSFVSRMRRGDPNDPLLRQVLPMGDELEPDNSFSTDPLEESKFNPVRGIVHKYAGRVLLITSPQCAINCRYCFRRHFDYSANSPSRKEWQDALEYIRLDNTIEEVILSGGDPLAASDRQLKWLLAELAGIAHLTRLRIHSRLPIVLPSRITPELIEIIRSSRLQPVMVIHANHANEVNGEVGEALNQLKNANITLLNQSVLLKGVNDSAAVLASLSKVLFGHGVLPYYVHMLDLVKGAAGFKVDPARARAIYRELLTLLPGYLVPRPVKEDPGAASKTPVI